MTKLVKIQTMTSLEIARLTGKRHDNVVRDIREILHQLDEGNALKFEDVYKDAKGEKRPMFALPERELMILLTGYSVPLRAKVIDRWKHPTESPLRRCYSCGGAPRISTKSRLPISPH